MHIKIHPPGTRGARQNRADPDFGKRLVHRFPKSVFRQLHFIIAPVLFQSFPARPRAKRDETIRNETKNFPLCRSAFFGYDGARPEVIELHISETWSLPAARIRAFFLAQSDVLQRNADVFSCRQCEIRLTSLPPRTVGRFDFPQTRVEFSGPEEDTEAIRKRFVLQFISAGG